MKLIERELGLEVELKENVISVIVLENIARRLSLIEELYMQWIGKEGHWMLVDNEKNYELSKCMELILEPFSLQLNNKKLKTKLYQDLKVIADDCFNIQGLELHAHICRYLENILEKMPYPVKYTDEWSAAELFKLYSVELEESEDDVCEKLFHYLKLMNQVCGTKIFITVNLKEYLTENQIRELYKMVRYCKLQLVLIEFRMHEKKNEGEEVYVLDKDDCIIAY